ncbi:MAG: NAD(P)-binding domain-containing protein [Kiloniellaceae bacterium]
MVERVAVIGAGPCGLAGLRAFAEAKRQGAAIPEVVCFEKQAEWGGLWNYSWRSGTDANGEPLHNSMYRYLWSNGPKECLEFADYTFDEHFGQAIPSFPPREVLFDYIKGRAAGSGVRDWVRFETAVRWVAFDEASGSFAITSEDLKSGATTTERFDLVVVANGHFSVPNIPDFAGIGSFPGRIMHAHDFRDAREFAGRDIVIVGGSYSAEDIALQSWKYGAKSVTISYRSKPMGFDWPEGVREVPLITRIEGPAVHFKDGSQVKADAIVLCTGYRHSFPFLAPELALRTHNRLYPPGLYKGVVWEQNPKLLYLGMQDQFYTFSMFDLQAWYARDVILGRVALPRAGEMAADSAAWVAREEALSDPLQMIDFQADYMRDLQPLVDYPGFDLDLTVEMFKAWEHDKEHSITGYRDKSFTSPCTGTVAPLHHTPWAEAMDDTMACFMGAPPQRAAG